MTSSGTPARTQGRGAKASIEDTFMYMHVLSKGVGFGLQTLQCLVYWSHNYTIVSWGSGGVPPENVSSVNLSTTSENVPLQDRREGKGLA